MNDPEAATRWAYTIRLEGRARAGGKEWSWRLLSNRSIRREAFSLRKSWLDGSHDWEVLKVLKMLLAVYLAQAVPSLDRDRIIDGAIDGLSFDKSLSVGSLSRPDFSEAGSPRDMRVDRPSFLIAEYVCIGPARGRRRKPQNNSPAGRKQESSRNVRSGHVSLLSAPERKRNQPGVDSESSRG